MVFWNRRNGRSRSNLQAIGGASNSTPNESGDNPQGLPSFQEAVGTTARAVRSDPVRARMRVAFTPSQPVSDVRMFAGRQEVLSLIIRAIEDQRLHVVLFGDRGIGKTSTLHVLAKLADQAGYIVHYTSCGESSTFDEIFRAALSEVPLLYHSDFDPAASSPDGVDTLAAVLPQNSLTVADVTRVMGKMTSLRLLIILDEFDRCEFSQFRKSVAELIKNLSDRSLPVQIVIGGVAANLSELLGYLPSIRRNILGLPLPSMTYEELSQIISIGSAVSGLPYDEDAVAAIAKCANGSPYLGSLLGHHAGIAALDRSRSSVTGSDVNTALDLASKEMELRIAPDSLRLIRNITEPKLRLALEKLAREALTTIGQVELVGSSTGIAQETLTSLERAGIIHRIDGHGDGIYRFSDQSAPMLIWLQSLQRWNDPS